MREYFENEWLVQALAIGISHTDFWLMNPKLIHLYGEAYKLKQKDQDMMNWYLGQYVLDALRVSLDGFNEHPKAKYMEKPIFEQLEDMKYKEKQTRKEYDGLTKEDTEKLELEKAKTYFNSLKSRFGGNS